MDRFHRIYKLHSILAARRTPVSRKTLEVRMECSRATVLRTFSLERLHVVKVRTEAAVDVDDDDLERVLTSAYGIFAGEPKHTSMLRFTSEAARWVADEQWHSDQQSSILTDGSMELRVPYADSRELRQDILRYGPDVEFLEPAALRDAVADRLKQALRQYE